MNQTNAKVKNVKDPVPGELGRQPRIPGISSGAIPWTAGTWNSSLEKS